MNRTVRKLMEQRGLTTFAWVSPEASVYDALYTLQSSNSSALLVISKNRIEGIFSEKDFARASLKKATPLSTKVRNVMTEKVYYVEPEFTLEDCLNIMSMVHVRHLPVLESGRPIGLVSMRHIMEALVEDKKTKIRELTSYITGQLVNESEPEAERIASPEKATVLVTGQHAHEGASYG